MLTLIVNALVALFPGVMWLWIITRKDTENPEPRAVILWVFMLGVLGGPVILTVRPLIEAAIPTFPPLETALIDAFLITAVTEEIVKALAFTIGVLWMRHLDEPLDGIIYGAAAGLGFATFENAWYLRMTGEAEIVVMRAFTSTLAHACMTGSLAFTLGMMRLRWGRFGMLLLPTAGLIGVVFCHGVYDFVLLSLPQLAPLALVVVLPVMLVTIALQVNWARAQTHVYARRSASQVLKAFCTSPRARDDAQDRAVVRAR